MENGNYKSKIIKHPCKFMKCDSHYTYYFDLKDFYCNYLEKGIYKCPICSDKIDFLDI